MSHPMISLHHGSTSRGCPLTVVHLYGTSFGWSAPMDSRTQDPSHWSTGRVDQTLTHVVPVVDERTRREDL